MGAERILIQAMVVGVNDGNVLYPCCIQCYAKMLQNLQHSTWHCVRCNIKCEESRLMWRYRLSLCIADSSASCHVSLFGGTLAQHFGCPANDFQRFLTNTFFNGQPLQGEMIMHALETALMGKSYLFGLKLPSLHTSWLEHPSQQRCTTGNSPICLADLLAGQSVSQVYDQQMSHFVAVQMLPITSRPHGDHQTVMDVLKQLFSRSDAEPSVKDIQPTNSKNNVDANSSVVTGVPVHKDYEPPASRSQSQGMTTTGFERESSAFFFLHSSTSQTQSQDSHYGLGMFTCDSSMEKEFAQSQCSGSVSTPFTERNEHLFHNRGALDRNSCEITHYDALSKSPARYAQDHESSVVNSAVCYASKINSGQIHFDTCRSNGSHSSSVLVSYKVPDVFDETLDPVNMKMSMPCHGVLSVLTSEKIDSACQGSLCHDNVSVLAHSFSFEALRCQADSKASSLLVSEDLSINTAFSSSLNDSSLLLAMAQEDLHASGDRSCLGIPKTGSGGQIPTCNERGMGAIDKGNDTVWPQSVANSEEHSSSFSWCFKVPDISLKETSPKGKRCDRNSFLQCASGSQQVVSGVTEDMPDSEDLSLFLNGMALEKATAERAAKTVLESSDSTSCTEMVRPVPCQQREQCEQKAMYSAGSKLESARLQSERFSQDICDIASEKNGHLALTSVLDQVPADINVCKDGALESRVVSSQGRKQPPNPHSFITQSQNDESITLCGAQFADTTVLDQALSFRSRSPSEPSMDNIDFRQRHVQLFDDNMPDSENIFEFLNKISAGSAFETSIPAAKQDVNLSQACGDIEKPAEVTCISESMVNVSLSEKSGVDDSGLLDGSAELFFSQSFHGHSNSCVNISQLSVKPTENRTVLNIAQVQPMDPVKREKETPENFPRKKVRFLRRSRVSTVHDMDRRLERYSRAGRGQFPVTPVELSFPARDRPSGKVSSFGNKNSNSRVYDADRLSSSTPSLTDSPVSRVRPWKLERQLVIHSPIQQQSPFSQDLFSPSPHHNHCSQTWLKSGRPEYMTLAVHKTVHTEKQNTFDEEIEFRTTTKQNYMVQDTSFARRRILGPVEPQTRQNGEQDTSPLKELMKNDFPNSVRDSPQCKTEMVKESSPDSGKLFSKFCPFQSPGISKKTEEPEHLQNKQTAHQSRHSLLFNNSDALFDDSDEENTPEKCSPNILSEVVSDAKAVFNLCTDFDVKGYNKFMSTQHYTPKMKTLVHQQLKLVDSPAFCESPDLFSP